MKKIFLAIATMFVALTSSAQDNWLWPIQGQKVGTGILYRPQDYINKEHNLNNLFIEAEKGAVVVSPADGVVTFCTIDVLTSLTSSIACTFDKNYDQCVIENREDMKRRGIDEKYICVQLSLKIGNKTLSICGLQMDRAIKTGTRIKKGEPIGTVSYAYKAVSAPHIMLAVSNNSPLDPMSPFGLKSTFKAPVVAKPKDILTHAEAEADYRRMASSVREIYPSLNDLMPLADYDVFVEEQIKSIPATISRKDFATLLTLFNQKIHDSHLYINKSVSPGGQTYFSPLFFAMFEGKCIISMSTREYMPYVGREVSKIDSKPAAEVCAITCRNSNSYDAQVRSVHEFNLAFWPCIDYGMGNAPQKQGDKITIEFANGETLVANLIPQMNYAKEFATNWNAQNRINYYQGRNYSTQMLNDSTLYIGLSTFQLNEVETDSLIWHIHNAEARHLPYIIFDVRNNRGGHHEVYQLLTSALMGKMPDRPHISYSMANAAIFESPISNYPVGDSIITWLHPVEGKQGIYSDITETHLQMDSLGYNGKLYILTNSNSASASAFLAGTIKRNERGTIVGRETMSAYHIENAVKFAYIDLINSQFGINIPMIRCVIDDTISDRLPAGRGVIPDFDIPFTYKEFTYQGDYILDQTLQLISDGKGIK